MAAGRQPVASTRLRTGICNSLFQRAAAPGYGLKTNKPLPRSGTKGSALSVAAGFVPSEGRASKNGAGLLANPRQAPVLARTSGGPARPTCGWFGDLLPSKGTKIRLAEPAGRSHRRRRPATLDRVCRPSLAASENKSKIPALNQTAAAARHFLLLTFYLLLITPPRQNASELAIALAYSYLCRPETNPS